MEFIKDLTGSLLWATVFSVLFYTASIIAIGFLAKKSALLQPVGSGLKIIALFLALQLFLHLGAEINWHRLFRDLIEGFDRGALERRQKKLLKQFGLPLPTERQTS